MKRAVRNVFHAVTVNAKLKSQNKMGKIKSITDSTTESASPEEPIVIDLSLIQVLADYVLVKQVMKKKRTHIITDAATNDKDKFDFSFEIVQMGDECKRKIKVGDNPIFSEYVRFQGLKVITKTESLMVSIVVVHENDIIAIDNETPKIS
jgi:hypothetical protein